MDASRARMVWQETLEKKRYHLVNWQTVCVPISYGGLGIMDLEVMNKCLLMKHLHKFLHKENLP